MVQPSSQVEVMVQESEDVLEILDQWQEFDPLVCTEEKQRRRPWDLLKRGAYDNLKEGLAHLGVIGPELALNVDDESGCDSRE